MKEIEWGKLGKLEKNLNLRAYRNVKRKKNVKL